jgi:hypothetical protein
MGELLARWCVKHLACPVCSGPLRWATRPAVGDADQFQLSCSSEHEELGFWIVTVTGHVRDAVRDPSRIADLIASAWADAYDFDPAEVSITLTLIRERMGDRMASLFARYLPLFLLDEAETQLRRLAAESYRSRGVQICAMKPKGATT